MKVLFIYPDIITKQMNFCPAIHVLSAVLKREGYETGLIHINENATPYDRKKIIALAQGYDLFAVTSTTFNYKYANEVAGWLQEEYPEILVCLGGSHATIQPEDFDSSNFDIFCVGEGEEPMKELCYALNTCSDWTHIPNLITRFGANPVRGFLKDLNSLPFWDFDITDTKKILELRQGWLSISFSRGCPYECLQGDTVIDTTEGYFKIKDLVGKIPKVLTRNPINNNPEYAQVKEVKLTRKNATLIRIWFDNDTYIDCTPDHKFMTFLNGNQYNEVREMEVEAGNLKIGESVRAVHYFKSESGYIEIHWGRRKWAFQHRLMMEGILGRKLNKEINEQIHHIDKNKSNNNGSNLILTNKSHITLFHPEISERMKIDNAAKNMSHEQRVALGKSQIGKKRSLQSRINYRNSKLGEKNPQFKRGDSKYNKSRLLNDLPEINHKVVRIEKLLHKEDTYCMEVPGYDWFYANGVLVHNCTFCINHLYKKIELGENDKLSDYLRRRDPELAIKELESLIEKFDIKFFNIDDDLLTMYKLWMRKFTQLYRERIFIPTGIRYVINARADTLTDEIVRMLADSGCKEARMGFETGNEKLRNELLNKRTSNKALGNAFKTLDKYGIQSVAFGMMGLPGESWLTFSDTIEAIVNFKPKLMRWTFLFPYKHTRIYDICIERGLFRDEIIPDNRDYGSPLRFENISDKELFCFRFLLPWFVNEKWNLDGYTEAIWEFMDHPLCDLEVMIPDIIDRDRILSANCTKPHYRYYKNNIDYYELHDNFKNAI